MARIDDLISHVADRDLREQLSRAFNDMRRRKKFGLVFEEHIPETALLSGAGVHEGSQVVLRKEPSHAARFVVVGVDRDTATIRAKGSDKATKMKLGDLLVIKPFGEPVYPVLRPTGTVTRSPDRPYHVVINGENFHALQLLLFTHEGKVDCIYIDPPYNTGARDWKYNNRYVDNQDAWRHSKWLSMMEKRLRLARRLLKPDGVLIVMIDEHEVHHLGLLLEDLFPDAYRQMVSVVINPKGVTQDRFSRVEEHALFCFFGSARVASIGDDLLTPLGDEEVDGTGGERPRWKGLLRSGTNARREDRKNMFYPVLVDPDRGAVLDVGEPLLPIDKKPDFDKKINGLIPAWPVRTDGSLGNWGVGHKTLRTLVRKRYVSLGGYDPKRRTYGISYLARTAQEQIESGVLEIAGSDEARNVVDVRYTAPKARRIKTVWHRTRHDAGAYGADLLGALLGGRLFPFPKSLYAVRDMLAAVVGKKPDALILDFFAGSGTTLHSTVLLNSLDGGRRRCILVTNNDVDEATERSLNAQGLFPGDPEFEKHGISYAVTTPRVTAALTGQRPDGSSVPGKYTWAGGGLMAEGFEENAAFFDLRYEDADNLEFRGQFEDIIPALWLAAGGQGDPTSLALERDWLLGETTPMAALLDEDRFRAFRTALEKRPDVSHIWLVTDSETAFARMRERLPTDRFVGMLYRDYLRNFQINTGVAR